MIMNSGKLGDGEFKESIKVGIVERTTVYKYLSITVNEEGNLKDHIKEMEKKNNKQN